MIQNLTSEQRKILSGKRIALMVSPYEAAVIQEIRKHTHAEVLVTILDGVPYRCKLNISVMMEQSEQFEEIIGEIAKDKKT